MLIQTSEPQSEPVSVLQAKNYLRVDDDLTTDDALIAMLIGAARRYAESYTGRSFITQGWRLTLDAFPGPGCMGVPWGSTYTLPAQAIQLERGTVQAVSSIGYMDMNAVWQTLSPSVYVVDTSGCPGRVTPVFGQIWPPVLPQIGSVKVDYTAGYGDTPSTVPEGIKQWILMRLSTLYANREAVAILTKGKVEALPFVDSLLDPYCVVMA